MNLPDINSNLPCLRSLTYARRHDQQMSFSNNSKNIYSSSNKSKTSNPIPILIQLCIYPDENYACRTMRILFSSRYRYSPNVADDFNCNVLMYSLRYQRYKLFEILLDETILDLNLLAKDQQGNTILHYAILYGGNDTQIIDKLIEKYNKVVIKVDERNIYGFTPLLLAVFCGRYDLALALLTKTDASPFVRDHVQLKNMLDYVQIDVKNKKSADQFRKGQQYACLSREIKRLHDQLYQTLSSRREASSHTIPYYTYKNFFETILSQAIHDQKGSIRLWIMQTIDLEYLSSNLTNLLNYLNQRYPAIKTSPREENSPKMITMNKLVFQQENTKANVHNTLSLFDPDLRPKIILPQPVPHSSQLKTSKNKKSLTFKRVGTKLATLTAFSRSNADKKRTSIIASGTK